ncbi:MAG: hypothetical protein JWR33_673 [Naasia sp.]|nr:hypothetical protein [Naasia sp.]
MSRSDPAAFPENGGRYEIRLRGHLDDRWSAWFEGHRLTRQDDGTTTLDCSVPDQAALHGLLHRVRDVGLPLISVTPIAAEGVLQVPGAGR